MSYTVPTVAEFRVRFPAFSDVAKIPDATVSVMLDEGALNVDDSWVSQADFTLGRMLYIAHALTLEGFGTGAEAQAALGGTLGYQSMSSGTFSLTRFANDGSGVGSGSGGSIFLLTSYGRRLLALMRQNNPAVLVV